MRMGITWKGLALAALVTGCGEAALRDVAVTPPAGGSGGAGDVATKASPLTVDVRLRATGAEGFRSLLVLPQSVRVRVDGVELPVELVGAPVDLSRFDQAAKVATFVLPEGAQEAEVELAVAPAGLYETDAGAGWVDAPATRMRFRSSTQNLLEKGKAVVIMDAGKSFVAAGADRLALVPRFAVRY